MFSIESRKVKMIKIYCHVCEKYKKFKKPKISYLFKKKFTFTVSMVMNVKNICRRRIT